MAFLCLEKSDLDGDISYVNLIGLAGFNERLALTD